MTPVGRFVLASGGALVLALAACDTGGTGPLPTTTARVSTPTASTPAPSGRLATSVLATLAVKGRAARTGYDREQFGPAWTDDNGSPGGHNGCDTRNDILRRDLGDDVLRPGTAGCVLLTGVLLDPYTARTITFRRGEQTSSDVQIDHVVALSDAWQTGAQQLSADRRRDLANDPLELLAVDGRTNQAKGDGDAATWLPPNKGYRCSYVSRQIAVKRAYGLWVTPAEHGAMAQVLSSCPQQSVPREVTMPSSPPPASRTTTAPPGRSTAADRSTTPGRSTTPSGTSGSRTDPAGCATTPSGNCIRGGQFCKQTDYGRTGTDADGARLTCAGDRQRPRWGR